jgi:hypothetical protein
MEAVQMLSYVYSAVLWLVAGLAMASPAKDELPAASSDFAGPCAQTLEALMRETGAIEFAVATLPDPTESTFSREFDLFLSGIQRGMESLGFSRDRHCLPWSLHEKRAPTGSDEASSQTVTELTAPGVLIFRNGADAQVVYLVGETPPWGVNQKMLERALDEVKSYRIELEAARPASERCLTPIKILGPTFSGSVASLAAGLEEWWSHQGSDGPRHPSCGGCRERLEVVSGTATRTDNASRFLAGLPSLGDCASYESTATSNELMRRRLWEDFAPEFLSLEASPETESVVILQESSVYGTDLGGGFQYIPFPMNISTLVEEYRKVPERLAGQASSAPTPDGMESVLKLPKRTLPLRLGSRPPASDRVPLFSRTTTNSADLVLSRAVAEIERRRAEYVVIVATSTEDTIFLAQYIKARAPNVRLITFEGDLLLAHPDLGQATRGMLVVSSNPMVEPSPFEETASFLQFPSDGAHGIYKATRRLLGDGIPGGAGEVWLSVVGKGALEVLKRYPEPMQTELAREVRLPRGWYLVFSFASLLVAATIFFLALNVFRKLDRFSKRLHGLLAGWSREGQRRRERRMREISGAVGDLHWLAPNAPVYIADPAVTRRLAYLTFLVLALCFGYPLIAFPFLRTLATESPTSLGYLTGALMTALVLAACYLLAALIARTTVDVRQVLKREEYGTNEGLKRVWPAVLALVAALGATRTTQVILDSDRLLLQRFVNFSTGVNPLAPALLIATVPLTWIIMALYRTQAVEGIPRPPVYRNGNGTDLFRRPGESLEHIRRCTGSVSFALGPWFWLLLVPLLYLAYYYPGSWTRLLLGVDGPIFENTVSLLFVIGAGLCVASGLASRRIWRELRKLLSWMAECLESVGGSEWLNQHDPRKLTFDTVGDRRAAAYERLCEEDAASLPSTLPRKTEGDEDEHSDEEFARAWTELVPWVKREASKEAENDGGDEVSGCEDESRESGPPPVAEPLGAALRFLTWQTAAFARKAIRQTFAFMVFMTAGLLLLLAALSAYPFEPSSVLHLWLGILIVLGAGISVATLVQMERSPAVDRFIEHSARFSRGRSVVARFGFLGGLPVLGLLASRFPQVGELMLDLLTPLLQVIG